MTQPCSCSKAMQGITLPEITVVIGLVSVLMAAAVASFPDWLHHNRLRGAAEVMSMELRWAVSDSLQRNVPMSLTLKEATDERGWCYGLRLREACDCHESDSCVVDGFERVTRGSDFQGVAMDPGVSGNRFSTQPKRSTVTSGNVLFIAANGKQLKVVVTGLGRVRICSPKGESYLSGHAVC